MSRKFRNFPEYELKPGESFSMRAFSKGLNKDSKCKHLVILFFVLQVYALQAISTGEISIAIATSLPAFFLPYTWTFNRRSESILGIPFRFILPYQGIRYTKVKYSPKDGKTLNGPATDTYLDCSYALPLYLALWFSYLGTVFHERVTFFVLVAVLCISRHEYWTSHQSFRSSNHSLGKLVTGLKWQFLVGTFTLALWTIATNYVRVEVSQKRAHPSQLWAIDEGPALAMICVVLLKVIAASKRFSKDGSEILFYSYGLYWEDFTTDEEIAIWEKLEWKNIRNRQLGREWIDGVTREEIEEYEVVEWQKAEEEQRRRLAPRITNLAKHKRLAQGEVYTQQSSPRALYREDSTRPQVKYRGSSSDEDDEVYTPQHPPLQTRPATPAVPLRHALLYKRAQIASRLEETLRRDPAFRERLIESQIKNLPVEEAKQRTSTIKQRLITKTLARIARQRTAKPRRAPTSLAPRVPYNDSNHPSPVPKSVHWTKRPDASPPTQNYISIIEDPAALDVDASSTSSDSDSDGGETDVFTLESTYPDSTFPRRAWQEALADGWATPDYILACWHDWASRLFMFLAQAFVTAVLVRYALIVTDTWPLYAKEGNNADVVKSAWWAIRVVIGIVYARWLLFVEYWGRIVREVVESLVNDWFFTVLLVVLAAFARSMWLWFNRGEAGLAFWVVRGTYDLLAEFLDWNFT
ncbi:hypothetical protein PMIN06_010918 [Paraphaeosphaeria minitans]|uniref:Uncharacterized protein n=1 Tax=Paraphaeosphaeria minitans TaxID=565426 RepID=A0A9P6GE91_9PLEO|nr:hypothetical protein PMIN01_09447 [Paraphaeosphaeria minitans]